MLGRCQERLGICGNPQWGCCSGPGTCTALWTENSFTIQSAFHFGRPITLFGQFLLFWAVLLNWGSPRPPNAEACDTPLTYINGDMPSAQFVSKATLKCLRPDLLASLTNWPSAHQCGFAHKPFASQHTIRTCWGLRPQTPAFIYKLNSHLIKFSSHLILTLLISIPLNFYLT